MFNAFRGKFDLLINISMSVELLIRISEMLITDLRVESELFTILVDFDLNSDSTGSDDATELR